MHRCERRVWMVLVVLTGLALCAGTASALPWSSNVPNWWTNPAPSSSNVRAGWWTWNGQWVDGQGVAPDGWMIDFDVHPSFQEKPWEWSHAARNRENISESGILIPPGYSDWEIDMIVGNRQLHAWKRWYLEFHLGGSAEDIARFASEGRLQIEWFGKKEIGGEWFELGKDTGTAEIIREGWDGNVWYAEYYFEPQPDMEKVNWTFMTDSGDPMEGNLYMASMFFGTTCSPEPVTMVLLALGLPMGLLARRYRKEH